MGKRGPKKGVVHGNNITHGHTLDPDRKLTTFEERFLNEYIKCGSSIKAFLACDPTYVPKGATAPVHYDLSDPKSKAQATSRACTILQRPAVVRELVKRQEELRNESIADAKEILEYFTAVMRGEIKDQFGLDAALADRTKAAVELARRTLDQDLAAARQEKLAGSIVAIRLDWNREAIPEEKTVDVESIVNID